MSSNFPTVKVGQELAFEDGSSMRSSWGPARYTFGWIVERVTPTGKGVAVRKIPRLNGTEEVHKRGFQHQGYETQDNEKGPNPNGAVRNYGGRFYQDVEGLRAQMERQARSRKASEALNEVKLGNPARDTWSKDSMLEEVTRLEALVAAARAAVEAI